MGKLLTVIALLCWVGASGQSDSFLLGNMNKVVFAKLYITEVQRVTRELSVVCFDSVDANVPATKYTNKKFRLVAKKVASYNQTLMEQFVEIIPYSDRKELLEAILYLREL
jgi:hypothetical protein